MAMIMHFFLPHYWTRKATQRLIAGDLGPREHVRLAQHVRSCAACRKYFERHIQVIRLLEGRVMARCETEHVAALLSMPEKSASRSWAFPWLVLTTLGAATALLVIVRPQDDSFAVRGTSETWDLALNAYCGEPPHEVTQSPCLSSDFLTFSYRLRQSEAGHESKMEISIFGVDASGDPLYYLPTPDFGETLRIERDAWQALPFSTHLAVNHEAGRVRVFALAAARMLTIAEIDALAKPLSEAREPQIGDVPWHLDAAKSLPDGLCPDVESCHSAQLTFEIADHLP
jgi:hypothetical protein